MESFHDNRGSKRPRDYKVNTREIDISDDTKNKDIQDELTCPICHEFYQSPVILEKCAHTFCEKCISDYEKSVKNKIYMCPLCKTIYNGVTKHRPNITMKKMFLFLQVKCNSELCNWVGAYDDLFKHYENSCEYIYKCECGDFYYKEGKYDHDIDCLYSNIECACKANVKKIDFAKHLETCPKENTFCVFRNFGCEWSGPRETYEEHKNLCSVFKKDNAVTSSLVSQLYINSLNLECIGISPKNIDEKYSTYISTSKDIKNSLQSFNCEIIKAETDNSVTFIYSNEKCTVDILQENVVFITLNNGRERFILFMNNDFIFNKSKVKGQYNIDITTIPHHRSKYEKFPIVISYRRWKSREYKNGQVSELNYIMQPSEMLRISKIRLRVPLESQLLFVLNSFKKS